MTGPSPDTEGGAHGQTTKPSKPTRPSSSGGDFLNRIVAAQRRQAGARSKRDGPAALPSPEGSVLSRDAPVGKNQVERVHSSDNLDRDTRGNNAPRDGMRMTRNLISTATKAGDRERSQASYARLDRRDDEDDRDFVRDLPRLLPRDTATHGASDRLNSQERRLYDVSSNISEARRPIERDAQSRLLGVRRDLSREGSHHEPPRQVDSLALTSGSRAQQPAPANGKGSIWSRDGGTGDSQLTGSSTGRKLFNPSLHDPLAFQKAAAPAPPAGSSIAARPLSSNPPVTSRSHNNSRSGQVPVRPDSRSQSRAGFNDRDVPRAASTLRNEAQDDDSFVDRRQFKITTEQIDQDDLAADRARERRKRKEGSEKGSLNVAQNRKRDEERSRGSRSSEGSESLKDRERGRGKSDTGIMPRLREAYKGIQALEQNLAELHRKMAADPAGGVRNLVRSGSLMDASTQSDNAAQIEQGDSEIFSRALLNHRPAAERSTSSRDQQIEDEGWIDLIGRHKRLADAHHDFMTVCLDPLIPASLHSLPVKYNIPTRLWQSGFHLLLERMRYTWIANAPTGAIAGPHHGFGSRPEGSHRDGLLSAKALDHLTDFIYDAYSFYTNLLEEQVLANFRTAWLEALGDLARYRMAIAAHVAAAERAERGAARKLHTVDHANARIDDDETKRIDTAASIGAEVAENWNVEERETWRITARDWYVQGVTERPGEGRLHHHLGLLCRDVPGEELRALYHLGKSLTASHPYPTAKESILPLFDLTIQRKRSDPDASATDLFVLMHGMLFTKIQLDDFPMVSERFMERLEEDAHVDYDDAPMGTQITEIDWILMANINIAALMQYGSDESLLKKAFAEESASRKIHKLPATILATRTPVLSEAEHAPGEALTGEDQNARATRNKTESQTMDQLKPAVTLPASDAPELEQTPASFQHTCALSFRMLQFCFQYPFRRWGFFDKLNPYITSILTFLCTIIRQPSGLAIVERAIPWESLIGFLNTIPDTKEQQVESSQKLTGGTPLPEDWCMRGMEWVGRRVYERGFWKSRPQPNASESCLALPSQRTAAETTNEMDVLLALQDFSGTYDLEQSLEDIGDRAGFDRMSSMTQRRWKRVAWTAGTLVRNVPGLIAGQTAPRIYTIEGILADKLSSWRQQQLDCEQAAITRRRREEEVRGEWPMDQQSRPDLWEDEDEDSSDDPLLLDLRERRRRLKMLLHGQAIHPGLNTTPPSYKVEARPLPASSVPGFTVLVLDTNVLLSSLELVARLIESIKWTVVIPLPVVTELDGLAKQATALGLAATEVIRYLEVNIKAFSISLKIQTSKGNYLSNLLIRSEMIDIKSTLSSDGQFARLPTMDDHILQVAGLHLANFADRSRLLHGNDPAPSEERKKKAAKVTFLTLDRNLRLRARARGIEAASERDMAEIFAGARL